MSDGIIPTPQEATERRRLDLREMVDRLAVGSLKNGEDHCWFEALIVFSRIEAGRREMKRKNNGDVPINTHALETLAQLLTEGHHKRSTDTRDKHLRERGIII